MQNVFILTRTPTSETPHGHVTIRNLDDDVVAALKRACAQVRERCEAGVSLDVLELHAGRLRRASGTVWQFWLKFRW